MANIIRHISKINGLIHVCKRRIPSYPLEARLELRIEGKQQLIGDVRMHIYKL